MQPTVRMDEGLENYTASVHSEAITAPVRFMHIDCKVSNKPAERTTTLTLPTVGLT